MTDCPSRERLERFLGEQCPEAERAVLAAHVGACPNCRDTMTSLKERSGAGELSALLSEELSTADREAEERFMERLKQGPPWRVPGHELLGELGRGAMGVVYKARQVGLDRVVALKMILAGGQAGEQDQARFRSEAQAAARLRHPNIVAVHEVDEFEVGEQVRLPFFSLELVEGGTLAQRLQGAPQPPREAAALVEVLARAIQHAHENGVVHRDLKPANVLLAADGTPKVSDFGLAKRLDGAPGQTASGAVMGTPSYMAPEQAQGKSKEIGPAADVYALGAVLYEMLTGRPPFKGERAVDTLLQVIQDDPVPPRRLVPGVPRDLETICLKCLRKEPHRRYASALDLAEDLRRFQGGEPIVARPVRWPERAVKWARRRPAAAGLVAALVLLVGLGGAGGAGWQQRRQQERLVRVARQERAAERAEAALEQVGQLRRRMHWQEAGVLLDQARDAVKEAEDDRLVAKLQQTEAGLALAQGLYRVREQAAAVVAGTFNPWAVKDRYPAVFLEHGLDVLNGPVEALAERIRASAARDEALAALDDWARFEPDETRQLQLLRLTAAVDPENRWRKQLLQPGALRDRPRLRALLAEAKGEGLAPSTAVLLARLLGDSTPEALELLARVRERAPDDFWLNFTLAAKLVVSKGKYVEARDRGRQEEAIGYFRAAVAVKRDSPVAHNDLGGALHDRGDLAGATRSYREAIRLDPLFVLAHNNLGIALRDRGRLEEAVRCHRKAIRLAPRDASVHANLGITLHALRDVKGAIRSYREAIRLSPKLALAHNNLGSALRACGDLDGSLRSHRKAVRLDPEDAEAHYNLGIALGESGDPEGAIRSYREAIRLNPRLAQPHINLGTALEARGDREGAIRCYREAIRLGPRDAKPHYNLGRALYARQDLEGAIRSFQEAVRLDPNHAPSQAGLGAVLLHHGDYSGSRPALERALVLLPAGHRLRPAVAAGLATCRQMLEQERALAAVLAGQRAAKGASERVALATLALRPAKQLSATAARLFAEAFREQPGLADDLRSSHRFNAACAAALAGCGQGKDAARLDAAERARWRRQALDWLRADLAVWARHIASGAAKERALARRKLQHWQRDADLAGVRDDRALAELPAAERQAWRRLWAEVDRALEAAEEKAAT
jgi:serine/threonine-protein kinase